MNRFSLTALTTVAVALSSCDNSDEIGASIITDDISIVNEDDFTIAGKSIRNEQVQSRTTMQLIGSIDATEYGSLYSDFVTQFMPASSIETEGVIVDGITLRMAIPKSTGYVGDTIVPMGLEVYELTDNLKYPIYSSFGDEVANYYNPSKPIASKVYNFNTAGLSDSIKALAYFEIPVDLPKSLAQRLFDIYVEDKNNYLIPEQFAKKFHGLYVKSNYGDGRVVKIGATMMSLKYHIDGKTDEGKDTTYNYVGDYYGVSPEIITNNNITYRMSKDLEDRYTSGENLLVAPIGLDMEIKFPINDIRSTYLEGAGRVAVINSLSFSLPVEEISNDYGITPPPYILMVRSDKKNEFFAKNQITDNLTSFLGTYNSTDKCYNFPDMRAYLTESVKNDKPATEEEYTFTITPVTVNTETESSSSYYYYYSTPSTTISSIVPYVETPVMVKILLDDAKISLSYSKQTVKI
ncbi:MAG: DUF4270 domain-containing protein [Bacteroides sp.]|nr:DUF4270 domain-containing protein [Bacteroides sp.]